MFVTKFLLRALAGTLIASFPWSGMAVAQTSPPPAQTAPDAAQTSSIDGVVVDASTGLPLGAATISVVGRVLAPAVSDARGHFHFVSLPIGVYQLHVDHSGYQPAVSDSITLTATQAATVTLALQSAPTGQKLRVIGTTSAKASQSLQKSSVIYRTLSAETLAQTGVYRVGDALRQLPGVNNGITGDTAALSDDINLSIRGIGTLETVTQLDGHPIGYGIPGGYNYQLSPVLAMRNINVLYGSGGSDLYSDNAIGGVVDFQTIDPTPDRHLTLNQGYGTFSRLATNLQYTGTSGRLGYALDFGTAGVDGPFKNSYFPQPGAAFDPSAPPGSLAYPIYLDDSAAVARVAMVKLRYNLSNASRITFTNLNQSYWENKTGNGDGDYLDYPAALAFGKLGLANANANPSGNPCGPSAFTPINSAGVPAGIGPDGKPDGGVVCQTPQQYAHFNTGFDGAGVAWQSFNFNDEHVAFESTPLNGKGDVKVDVFTNRYLNTGDRTFQLPFKSDGDYQASWSNSLVTETGAVGSDDVFTGVNNRVGAGYSVLNSAYMFLKNAKPKGSPNILDSAIFLRDVYHPTNSPLTAYANVNLDTSTATNTSSLDPRLSLVYQLGANNVVRVAEGVTSTQPAGNQVDVPFVSNTLGGAGGGTPINCSGLNSIGSAPSSVLKPERGVDTEVSFGHRFFDDSMVQLAFYNVNVFDKLYSAQIPLSQSGTGFIDPATLQAAQLAVASKCGLNPQQATALLGISGTQNLGQLQARGFTLNGRARFDRRTFIDYDWDTDSTVFKSIPTSLLQSNRTFILDSQLPRLPLHTFQGSLDHNFGRGIDARYTIHTVSVNNTKSLPAYNYSDLTASTPLSSGTFAVTISNLFNQYADIRGLRYEGVPLPLNQYATKADYAPFTGVASTEWFGLPYRQIFLNYTFQTR